MRDYDFNKEKKLASLTNDEISNMLDLPYDGVPINIEGTEPVNKNIPWTFAEYVQQMKDWYEMMFPTKVDKVYGLSEELYNSSKDRMPDNNTSLLYGTIVFGEYMKQLEIDCPNLFALVSPIYKLKNIGNDRIHVKTLLNNNIKYEPVDFGEYMKQLEKNYPKVYTSVYDEYKIPLDDYKTCVEKSKEIYEFFISKDMISDMVDTYMKRHIQLYLSYVKLGDRYMLYTFKCVKGEKDELMQYDDMVKVGEGPRSSVIKRRHITLGELLTMTHPTFNIAEHLIWKPE